MSSFTKLDSGIVDSSIWNESAETRVVWITLLAKCDKTGYARLSLSGLQRAANVPLSAVEKALKILESPDKESRTSDHNGRRVLKIEGGWHVVNYEMYRNNMIREASKEEQARIKREYRASKGDCPGHVPDKSGHVVDPSASAYMPSASEEPEGDARGNQMKLMRENLNGLYDRDPKKRWSNMEESLLFQVVKENPDCLAELAELRNYERKTTYFPKSIVSLLSDWSKHLDAAKSENRNVKKEQFSKPKTILDKELDSIRREIDKI